MVDWSGKYSYAALRPARGPRYLPAVTIRLGIVDCGSFSHHFISLFQAYPLVDSSEPAA